MEKYKNKLELHRRGGRFAKAPSLEEMGMPVAKGEMTCICGHKFAPILTTGYCPKCRSQEKKKPEERGLPEYVTTGFSRAEWHDKAWALYQEKRFSNTLLSAVSIHTIRTVFDATFDALMEVSTKGSQ